MNHLLVNRLFFLIGCVQEFRLKESVRERCQFRGTEVNSVAMKLSAARRPYCERIDHQFVSPWRRETQIPFSPILQTGQETVNLNPASLQTQERETVVMPLPVSMHAGQIFLLTKLLTATDLGFYDFEGETLLQRWRSPASRASIE